MAWMQALESFNPDYLQHTAEEGKTKNRAHDVQSSTLLLTTNQNCSSLRPRHTWMKDNVKQS